MKSNYLPPMNKTKVHKLANEAAAKAANDLRDEIQNRIEIDVAHQTISTVFWVLHKHFGFDADRLQKLKDLTEDEFKFMIDGILGREYNPRYCEEWLKSIGIDLDESQYK